MRFYTINCIIKDLEFYSRRYGDRLENADSFAAACKCLFFNSNEKEFVGFTNISRLGRHHSCEEEQNYITSDARAEILLALKNSSSPEKILAKLFKLLERTVSYDSVNVEEIGIISFLNCFMRPASEEYAFFPDKYLQDTGMVFLKCYTINSSYNLSIKEGLISEEDFDYHSFYTSVKSEIDKKIGIVESFNEEIDRIANTKSSVKGIPAHYMVLTETAEASGLISERISEALFVARRVNLPRFTKILINLNNDPNRPFFSNDLILDTKAINNVYDCATGGVIILELSGELNAENQYANIVRSNLCGLCDIINKYKNDVTTVLCIKKESNLKTFFYDNLDNISFVELKEELLDTEYATRRLKRLAKARKVRTDKELFKDIHGDSAYSTIEIDNIFDRWFNKKLRTVYYPEYKNTVVCAQKVKEGKAKGDAYSDLQNLIGLDSAKSVVEDALNYYKAKKVFMGRGIPQDETSKHMVFTGNPGTAKTTVARLFAQIMADNGVLQSGHIVECGRSDLVGKYVGWTAKTVKEKFKIAKGGILFIDEAYSLVDGSNSFGDEAINTIVQEMENMRDEVIVIFAGYPDKMEEFLNKNPGLRSRIAFHVNFEDYNENELMQIAELIARKKGLTLADDVNEKLIPIFREAMKTDDYGNGRFARNLVEKAHWRQATRLIKTNYDDISDKDIKTLIADDFESPKLKTQSCPLGFAS